MESAIFGGLISMAAALWFGLHEIAKAIKTRTVNVNIPTIDVVCRDKDGADEP